MVVEHRVRTSRAGEAGTEDWVTPFDLSTVDAVDMASAEIVSSYAQADALPIKALADQCKVDGIVTAGTVPVTSRTAGHRPRDVVTFGPVQPVRSNSGEPNVANHSRTCSAVVQQAARGRAVDKGGVFVSTTRAGSGSVYDDGTPGVVVGADLQPSKARYCFSSA